MTMQGCRVRVLEALVRGSENDTGIGKMAPYPA